MTYSKNENAKIRAKFKTKTKLDPNIFKQGKDNKGIRGKWVLKTFSSSIELMDIWICLGSCAVTTVIRQRNNIN